MSGRVPDIHFEPLVQRHYNMSKPHSSEADLDPPDGEETLSSDFPIPAPTTGTVDDDDDPTDERADENEIPVREKNENTETSDEFRPDDEDRDPDA
jgi:hypothetical protein